MLGYYLNLGYAGCGIPSASKKILDSTDRQSSRPPGNLHGTGFLVEYIAAWDISLHPTIHSHSAFHVL